MENQIDICGVDGMRLADCVEYLSRGKSPNYVDRSEITVINQACIYWDGINSSKVRYHNPNSAYEKAVLQNGDVLVNSTGTGTLGRAAVYYDFGEITIADSHVTIIRADKSKVLPEFLCLYLRHESTQNELYSKCVTGSTNQIELSKEKLLSFPMPEIPVEVQHDIVRRLGKISRIITIRNKELSTLDDLIKARFVEMFGDTILNPFGWEKDLLGIVCDVRDGTHDSPQYHETGFPLVTSKNVTGGKIDLTDCSLISEEDFKKINERSKVDIGDIIMPMIGTVGKPVIVDIEPGFAIKNVSLIKFRHGTRVLNKYIRALLQSDYFDDAVLSKVRGGTQKFISLGDIRNLEILVPPMEKQKQFGDFVLQIDKTKSVIQKSLDETQLLFDSLMQQYFG